MRADMSPLNLSVHAWHLHPENMRAPLQIEQ